MDLAVLPVPREKEKFDFDAIIVSLDGTAVMLDGNFLPSDPVDAEYYAIGSGKDFALGALACERSAHEAVKVACLLDAWTGGAIVEVAHECQSK